MEEEAGERDASARTARSPLSKAQVGTDHDEAVGSSAEHRDESSPAGSSTPALDEPSSAVPSPPRTSDPSSPRLLVRPAGSTWRPPAIGGYRFAAAAAASLGEQMLQKIVADSPELLGLPLVAVARELSVPDTGSLDLACVDGSGAITLVECKLRDNAEIRRTVIGQILAYAAGLWRLDYAEFERRFNRSAQVPLLEAARRTVGEDDWDDEAFRRAVAATLAAGRFDLVIAVDAITEELKRIVRYLNEHTISEMRVLAFELAYAKEGDLEILVPALYGQEMKPSPSGPVWDESKLFATLAERCPQGETAVRAIYEHAMARGAVLSWGRAPLPAVTASFEVDGARARVWTCQTHETPNISVNFDWMREVVSLKRLSVLADRIGGLPGAAKRLDGLEAAGWRRRPGLPIVDVLSRPRVAARFCEAIDELIGGEAPSAEPAVR